MTQATPVRYMVTSSLFGMKYYVLDTSIAGDGRIVAKCDNIEDASMVASALEAAYPLDPQHEAWAELGAMYRGWNA